MTEQKAPLRSDGRRNRERLIAAASILVARDGAEASLEEIARQAGVGSATLHRHFRSRFALLDAVFRDGVERLRIRARSLAESDPGNGLVIWLGELTEYAAGTRGLATSLRFLPESDGHRIDTCHGILQDAATILAANAIRAGTLRPEVSVDDLLALANGISIAAEGDLAGADRLLRLAVHGFQATGPDHTSN